MTTCFDKNLAVLRSTHPELLEFADIPLPAGVEIIDPGNGKPTVRKHGKFIHSPYDPVSEAQAIISRSNIPDDGNVIVLGFGMGYHVSEIIRRKLRCVNVYVVEPDPAVFSAALRGRDVTDILKNKNFRFYVGQPPCEIYSAFADQALQLMAANISVLELQPSVACDRDYFLQVKPKIMDAIRTAAANIKTISCNGTVSLDNSTKNVVEMITSPGISALGGAFPGVPAVVVSAGPSLDKNIGQLAGAKGKCLILATDTALKILLKHGIKPDLIFTVDYKEKSRLHFEDCGVDDIPLVFDIEAARASLCAYRGPRFVIASNKPFSFWVNSFCGNKGVLPKGMSVAHCAFSGALAMGCDPVIFIGQDLSFPGGFSHANGTSSRISVADMKARNLVTIRSSITGEELQTDLPMYIYLRHFEKMVKNTTVRCINATEGGAGIEGMVAMPLREAIAQHCTRTVDVAGVIGRAHRSAPATDLGKAATRIRWLLRKSDRLLAASESITRILDELFVIARSPSPDTGYVVKLLAALEKPSRLVQREEFILRMLYSEIMKQILQLQREKSFDPGSLRGKRLADLPEDFREDYGFQVSVQKGLRLLMQNLDTALVELCGLHKKTKVSRSRGR